MFCTCLEKKSFIKKRDAYLSLYNEEEYLTEVYEWTLYSIVQKREEKEKHLIIGEIKIPIKKINDVITAELIVEELNKLDCFDFEYIPIDGDELVISNGYKHIEIDTKTRPYLPFKTMHFVYENKEWYFGYIDNFEYETKRIYEGEMKYLK
ncbi:MULTISPECIES: hypothetical protein [Flavobacterium]|uniref:Uncharacterized protein n=1 Tax=Flavobacterium jumunjinense TaxID=998845 RepID=A0ABV5GRR4_9FLAO|nr:MULTISPECIES: hypothetical protein [Flavobacterium]